MKITSLLPVIVSGICIATFSTVSASDGGVRTKQNSTTAAPTCCQAAAMTPTAFAQKVATIDMLEIALGKVAQKNAMSAKVKELGMMMITGHTKINANLTQVAASQNIQIPTALGPKAQAIVKKLSSVKGAAFDHAYTDAMVAGHTKALAMFQSESKTCANAALKKFAKQTTPIIAMHLKCSKAAQASLVKKP